MLNYGEKRMKDMTINILKFLAFIVFGSTVVVGMNKPISHDDLNTIASATSFNGAVEGGLKL